MLRAYLLHRLRARNAHGLHSPFVYQFYTTVYRPRRDAFVYPGKLEQHYTQLAKSRQTIDIQDFGAGSRTGSSNRRHIGHLVRHSACGQQKGRLLYRLVQSFAPQTILETGTCVGMGTAYLAAARPQAQIHTIEGCPQLSAFAQAQFTQLQLPNIHLHTGALANTLPQVLRQLERPLDLVYLDANHQLAPTLAYFEACLPYTHEGTCWVIDDIHWSAAMEQAWAQLCARAEIKLSLDLFWMGILLGRDKQPKQHFVLY